MQKYLDITEAAAQIGVSRYILRAEMDRGKLTGLKVGKRVLIAEDALESYLRSCVIQPVRRQTKQPRASGLKCEPGMKILRDGSVKYADGRIRYPDGHIEKPQTADRRKRA